MSSNIIKWLGFERAIDISSVSDGNEISQRDVIDTVISKHIEIDSIYFNKNHYSNKQYPAVFIMRVECFDAKTLKSIAETHRRVWNSKMVSFLYVHNETEIRIYNCIERPIWKTEEPDYEKELKGLELASAQQSDEEKLKKLHNVFSSIAIDSGIIWTLEEEEAAEIRKKININKRIDRYLVKSLVELAKDLVKDGLKYEKIHRLILRSLFLLYLEDRGATNKGDERYFDILRDVNSTYALFKKLEESFNGNVFTVRDNEKADVTTEHLSKIRQCFISGYENTVQLELFPDWRLFQFDIISIELLSEIYENFLAAIDPERKKISGAFYTPPSLVELMLDETLPVNSTNLDYNVKVLDPACGSGIFLVESYKRLVRRYEVQSGGKLSDYKILKSILLNNVYGIDIDSLSVKIAAFSLYLALLDNLDPKTLWQNKRLPYLINDPENKPDQQGRNLFVRDTIKKNEDIETLEFDLVIGNPPFGVKGLPEPISKYCSDNDFAQQMVIPFLHKAVQFSPKGKIAMIFTTKLLTNTERYYPNFRKWLFNECYVEKVYNFSILVDAPKSSGGKLFSSARCAISIVFYRKETPENSSNRITYYAPKTFIKSNVLEGIALDKSDIKYLPRKDCQDPHTKIWKIAMWGGIDDYLLITDLQRKYPTQKESFKRDNKDKDNVWIYGSGLNADKEQISKGNCFIPDMNVLELSSVEWYYTSEDNAIDSKKEYRQIKKDELFKPPYLIIKEGGKDNRICSSFIDYECYHAGYSITNKSDPTLLKALCALLNSSFAQYYLLITSSSWGIDKRRIQANETLSMPAIFENCERKYIKELSSIVDKIIKIKKGILSEDISELKDEIDKIINHKILCLSERDLIVINDTIKYSVDLYLKNDKSDAIKPIDNEERKAYAEKLTAELNDFLEGQPLYTNFTLYKTDRFLPLSMIKLSFQEEPPVPLNSNENLSDIIEQISTYCYERKSENIFFVKRYNYYDGDDIFIIRSNQRRFWSQKAAIEDAAELIAEIMTMR